MPMKSKLLILPVLLTSSCTLAAAFTLPHTVCPNAAGWASISTKQARYSTHFVLNPRQRSPSTRLFQAFWENILPIGPNKAAETRTDGEWAEYFDQTTNMPYYWNKQTGETVWVKPADAPQRESPPAPPSLPLKPMSPANFVFSDARRVPVVGAYSAAGKSNGRLKENQDAYIIQAPLRGQSVNLFAILDGHGESGKQVASFVARALPDALAKAVARGEGVAQGISDAFVEVDRSLIQRLGDKASDSGATATVVLHRGDTILVACVGDSRAVLGDSLGAAAQSLTTDHNPAAPRERARIEAAGGMVGVFEGEAEVGSGGKGRVFVSGEAFPGLATARAFGDEVGKSVGVTARPEFRSAQLARFGQIMVIASDGLWDVMDPAAAVAACVPFAAARDADGAARLLVDTAADLWPIQRSAVTVDDITVVVVFF